MFKNAKRQRDLPQEKILDVNASMQGTISFKEPVNLKINGNFEGVLDIKGNLTVGPTAVINATIQGDDITIAGKVNGDITARVRLKLTSTAHLMGNVKAPIFSIDEGALFCGNSQMLEPSRSQQGVLGASYMSLDELALFLEVEPSIVKGWAQIGKIPAAREGQGLKFQKDEIQKWLAGEKVVKDL